MDSRALSSIPRGWWGVTLSGYREPAAGFATYSAFADMPLPPIERELDDSLTWLGEQVVVPESLAVSSASPEPTRAANGAELKALGSECHLRVPASFAAFIGSLNFARESVPAQRAIWTWAMPRCWPLEGYSSTSSQTSSGCSTGFSTLVTTVRKP
jgi:hypothetical protein